ncbi:hypothetical protein F8M41_004142 [Gigaspora margarita]|uniref:Serine protease n=1 Tax=Gigaspora margarita TaxID=4874 RepID=A0A8H3XCQ1_GIGMA|nr:hypothetical protein F8M41_004142 [Gigaspora margarita]
MKLYNKVSKRFQKELLCGDGIYKKSGRQVTGIGTIGFFARDGNNSEIIYVVTTGHSYNDSGSNTFYFFPWGDRPDNCVIGYMEKHSIENYDYGLINYRAIDGIYINSVSFATELIITDMEAGVGDSGGPAYFYYENLYSVSLSGILTGGNKGITTILPLQIILDETGIVPILVN